MRASRPAVEGVVPGPQAPARAKRAALLPPAVDVCRKTTGPSGRGRGEGGEGTVPGELRSGRRRRQMQTAGRGGKRRGGRWAVCGLTAGQHAGKNEGKSGIGSAGPGKRAPRRDRAPGSPDRVRTARDRQPARLLYSLLGL